MVVSNDEGQPNDATDSGNGPISNDDGIVDLSRKNFEISLFERSSDSIRGLYVYSNVFNLVPGSIGGFKRLKTLKFFANEINILPAESGDLVELETLQLKISSPVISELPFKKLKALKELELCKVPPRLSTFSILSEIAGLKWLKKLSVCHFSIRYLPPEIGCLKKLEDLDLSFNKLKSLPNDIAALSALKSLKVANNKLVELPSGLSCLQRLENLDLSNNKLTSLGSLNLTSMHTLQYLNLQYNKLLNCCQIPSWVCCNFEGNGKDTANDEFISSLVKVDVYDVAIHKVNGSRSSNGCHSISSTLLSETSSNGRCSAARKMRKGWKRRDYLQQRARQERLNTSRKWKGEDQHKVINRKMAAKSNPCNLPIVGNSAPKLQCHVSEDNLSYSAPESISFGLHASVIQKELNGGESDSQLLLNDAEDECSCILSDPFGSSKEEEDDYLVSPSNEINEQDEESSSEASKTISKSKRHSDRDLDNPKPSKCLRPVEECSCISCKYSTESFCSSNDHLPDGFYDAGRDRPFVPLQSYDQSPCLDSREVILVDRNRDEELDAIALSAQLLMSNFSQQSSTKELKQDTIDNLQRASVLALFVSDCFGGSDRSTTILRMRKAVAGSNCQKPFVCTCTTGSNNDKLSTSESIYGTSENFNFADLCEKSLRFIKETRNSNIVPIGSLRFGVCRHRAVLLKYLCDRADPPILCELVRGYLDFMPHAWNVILVRRRDSWVRMVVDACHPTDIREEIDPEYFCRYIPLSRVHIPVTSESFAISECSFPSLSLCNETEKAASRSIIQCKFGTLVAAAKVRTLKACGASEDSIKNFEYTWLGEVRMLETLRKHTSIAEIYGHQLSCRWVYPSNGNKEYRILQSTILMEYIKGGSLKNYVDKLLKAGEKRVPVKMGLCIARDVACALAEVHSKHVIHRDIKSENILVDLDSKKTDGSPLVKLCDFDSAVPVHSLLHTCCISHLGIPPPDVCVGTPRWMAPEVLMAMQRRNPYGLEVDIWSYGCLLLELLTLQVPYAGLPESEIHHLLQRKQGPPLPAELEELASSDEPTMAGSDSLYVASEDELEMLKLLVDLFYQCTKGDPAERPKASHIYKVLCAASTMPET